MSCDYYLIRLFFLYTLVEHNTIKFAVVAQKVEHFHGKEKVPGSNPGNGLMYDKDSFLTLNVPEKNE